MGVISVAQAAQRLGVSVPRIHQRICDGSLSAQRIGSQWVVDELSLLQVGERSKPGRPISAASAWALIEASEAREDRHWVKPSSRVRVQLERLFEVAEFPARNEDEAAEVAVALRAALRNRAQRLLFRVAEPDLDDLRRDRRWSAVVGAGHSGIAASDVEGYLADSALKEVVRDYLLVESDADPNVIAHVIPVGQDAHPRSRLRLAADLAERRGSREEARAADLLHELAVEWREAT